MAIHNVSVELSNSKSICIETGKIALLAGGSVTVRQGDTIVLVAACSSKPRADIDFFPLQVDYREKFSASGQMPGGFFKREGRPSEKEILTCRMTDRPIRPLFPEGYFDEVQVQSLLLSADGENEADVLSMLGASIALMLSDMPFQGPIGALRVGRVNGEFVANPTHSEMADSDLDLVYAGIADKTIMIEGAADELSEEDLRDALSFANDIVKKQIQEQIKLTELAGKPKKDVTLKIVPENIKAAVKEYCEGKIGAASQIPEKEERYAALDKLCDEMSAELLEKIDGDAGDIQKQLKQAFSNESKISIRRMLLDEGKRSDGRAAEEIRPLEMEVGLLPRTHGSGLFARGETQALVVTTLGTSKESQFQDAITGGETEKKFLLHYNFPNYSVGETGRIMGPGRREIGHGALAERSVARMMPKDYPYTVRCISEVMGSNGSTSMASICGATLSMMDAGVPLVKPVAGISCGLVQEGDKTILLMDILGSEDHYGDMDFKVAGTVDGITGFQLDLKIPGISIDLMYKAMLLNKKARFDILDAMSKCISEPRSELSPYAPQIKQLKINPEKIGMLIGPGGKVIKGITEKHGVEININDDGTVQIYANNNDKMQAAITEVESITSEAKIGTVYDGLVKTVKDFGAFVEILPGQEGLVHISELADHRVEKVEDICKVGDRIKVKVKDVDDRGRIKLSRKDALNELEK